MSLFADASSYLADEYIVRNDLLVCPIMDRQKARWGSYADGVRRDYGTRNCYIPQPDNWYVFNLRASLDQTYLRQKLSKSCDGGTTFNDWDRSINNDPKHIPYITPMFVREDTLPPLDISCGYRSAS